MEIEAVNTPPVAEVVTHLGISLLQSPEQVMLDLIAKTNNLDIKLKPEWFYMDGPYPLDTPVVINVDMGGGVTKELALDRKVYVTSLNTAPWPNLNHEHITFNFTRIKLNELFKDVRVEFEAVDVNPEGNYVPDNTLVFNELKRKYGVNLGDNYYIEPTSVKDKYLVGNRRNVMAYDHDNFHIYQIPSLASRISNKHLYGFTPVNAKPMYMRSDSYKLNVNMESVVNNYMGENLYIYTDVQGRVYGRKLGMVGAYIYNITYDGTPKGEDLTPLNGIYHGGVQFVIPGQENMNAPDFGKVYYVADPEFNDRLTSLPVDIPKDTLVNAHLGGEFSDGLFYITNDPTKLKIVLPNLHTGNRLAVLTVTLADMSTTLDYLQLPDDDLPNGATYSSYPVSYRSILADSRYFIELNDTDYNRHRYFFNTETLTFEKFIDPVIPNDPTADIVVRPLDRNNNTFAISQNVNEPADELVYNYDDKSLVPVGYVTDAANIIEWAEYMKFDHQTGVHYMLDFYNDGLYKVDPSNNELERVVEIPKGSRMFENGLIMYQNSEPCDHTPSGQQIRLRYVSYNANSDYMDGDRPLVIGE